MSDSILEDLNRAWDWRQQKQLILPNGALRVFHGPGEGSGSAGRLSIDRFGPHFWVTTWDVSGSSLLNKADSDAVVSFLEKKGAHCVVWLDRAKGGVDSERSRLVYGSIHEARVVVEEGELKFEVQLADVRHPGLFLDHLPLRRWLLRNSDGMRVLNTFAYTGSFSVAAAKGDAVGVTTLDLSRPSLQWATENWGLNPTSAAPEFILGDVFEWLPRFRKSEREFDCVILDPPSFSRGKKGVFSTSKDLKRLHSLAMRALAPEGVLVTSINSANVSIEKYRLEVRAAAEEVGMRFDVIASIEMPETFPIRAPEDRYLKGWILKRK